MASPPLRPTMQPTRSHGSRGSRTKPARRFQLRPRTKEGRSAERQKKLAQTTAMAPKRAAAAVEKAMDAAPRDISLHQMRLESMAEASSGWVAPFSLPQTVGVFSDRFGPPEEKLGHGSLGTVRKCTDRSTGRVFACKSINKAALLPGQPSCRKVQTELSIRTRLGSHCPNVLPLHGVYEDQNCIHIVTELCSGGSLADALKARGSFAESDTAWLFRRIIRGVHACHVAGIMLRNLGPSAILLSSSATSGEPQLADFGSAVQLSHGNGVTGVAGTMSHMAPEVLCGAVYGLPADIWSLGVLLFQLLAGTLPFRGDSPPEAMAAICRAHLDFQEPPWPSISAPVKALVRQMLARDARNRPTTEHLLHHPFLRQPGQEGGALPLPPSLPPPLSPLAPPHSPHSPHSPLSPLQPLHTHTQLHGFCPRPTMSSGTIGSGIDPGAGLRTGSSGSHSSFSPSPSTVFSLSSSSSHLTNTSALRQQFGPLTSFPPQQMMSTPSLSHTHTHHDHIVGSPLSSGPSLQLPTTPPPPPPSPTLPSAISLVPSWPTLSTRPSLPLSPGLVSMSTSSSGGGGGGDPETLSLPPPFPSSMSPSPLPWKSLSPEASPEPLFAHYDFPPLDLCLKPDQTYILPSPSPSSHTDISLMDPETTMIHGSQSNGLDLLSQTTARLEPKFEPKIELGSQLECSMAEDLPRILDIDGSNGREDLREPLISTGVPESRSPSGASDLTSASPKALVRRMGAGEELKEENGEKTKEMREAQRESTYDFLCGLNDLAESWSKESVLAQLAT